jgi:hypothetical protein
VLAICGMEGAGTRTGQRKPNPSALLIRGASDQPAHGRTRCWGPLPASAPPSTHQGEEMKYENPITIVREIVRPQAKVIQFPRHRIVRIRGNKVFDPDGRHRESESHTPSCA